MKGSLKATITTVLLTSVAVVPVATVSVVATTDAAFAKSDNAGGNGNGGGNGKGGGKGNGKSSEAKASSSGGKSATKGGKTGDVEGLLRKITGKDQRAVKRAAAPKKVARTATVEKGPMHPSNLGNMNGALNADTNAVLAHIRNGNTNGPIGHLAALALANVSADGAQEIIDLKQDFVDLQAALDNGTYESVEDYYAALDGEPGIDPIQSVEDAKAAFEADPYLEQGLIDALAAAGYSSIDDYNADIAGVEGVEEDVNLSAAIEVLGGSVVDRIDVIETEPSDEVVGGAQEDLDGQTDAEKEILAYWNKNPDDADEITAEEQALLDKLNERLTIEDAAIKDAMGVTEEETAACEVEEGCEELVDDEVSLRIKH